jgi:hypothetical protein
MTLKHLIREITPPLAQKGYRKIKSLLAKATLPPEETRMIERNGALARRHLDRNRCFVIGNGPSLKQQDLTPLRNEVVFACNFFNLHPQCEMVSPRYFCFADPNAFFPGTLNENLDINRPKWFADICAKAPRAEFLFPLEAQKAIEAQHCFSGRSIWYVARRDATFNLGFAESDLTKPLAWGQGTVTALAVPAAIFMGFKTIYLLGCDCNWWVDHLVKEKFDAEYVHFYEKNPFLPRECTLRDFGLEQELLDLSRHFNSWRLLRELAESKGVRILNATKGGMLDVFERIRFEAAML